MSSLGALNVDITGDASGLEAAARDAESTLSDLGGEMREGINTAGRWAVGMAAAGAAITAYLVRDTMSAIDEQAKLARQVNSTAESIAVLDRAASIAGMSQDELRSAAQKLNQRLGEARRGTGQAAETFDRLGLSVEDVANLPADERFEVIGRRMDELGWSTDQQADAWRNLGVRGSGIINLLEDNAAALRTAREEVDAFGTSVSDVDAATIERANDAMSAMGEMLQGVITRMTVKLAPVIDAIADSLRGVAMETEGFKDSVDDVFDFAVRAAGFLGDTWRGLQVTIKTLELAVQGAGTGMLNILSLVGEGLARIVSGAIDGVLMLVRTANRIPGINIPTEGLENFQAGVDSTVETLVGMRHEANAAVAETARELHELAMAPMPSTVIDEYLANARENSRAASEAVVNARLERTEGLIEAEEAEAEILADFDNARLRQLQRSLMTQEEAEIASYEERLETLREAIEARAVTEESAQEMFERMEREHMENMARIRGEGMDEINDITARGFAVQQGVQSGSLESMLHQFKQHGEGMNKASQALSAVQATIATYAGAAEALKLGWPQGPIAAASIIAQGMGMVRSIRSGGSGGSGVAAASAAPHRESRFSASEGQQSGGIDLDVIGGRTNDREFARRILNEANNLIGDGYELRVRGGG